MSQAVAADATVVVPQNDLEKMICHLQCRIDWFKNNQATLKVSRIPAIQLRISLEKATEYYKLAQDSKSDHEKQEHLTEGRKLVVEFIEHVDKLTASAVLSSGGGDCSFHSNYLGEMRAFCPHLLEHANTLLSVGDK